jgi:hypothetical protein
VPEEFQIPTTAAEAEGIIEGFSQSEPEIAPEAAAPGTPQEFAINYKGKEEKYSLDKLIQFAQQGRDYSANMQKYNQEKTGWTKQVEAEKAKWAGLEEKLSRYGEVEEYIKKDPVWWDHVQSSYQQRLSGQAPGANAPPDPIIQKLTEQVGELSQFVSSAKEREAAQAAEKEDLVMDQQITQYRDKYPNFDWAHVDENGLDLEKRILDHAVKMGLNKPEHFTAAANDYLHEEHLKRASESAKGDVGRHLQKVNKLGLGPITDHRTQAVKRVQNVSSKSWDEISQEAQAAAGIN